MDAQTLYQSWEMRLKLLDSAAAGIDATARGYGCPCPNPEMGRKQRDILQMLLAQYRAVAAAQQPARFPVYEAPAPGCASKTSTLRRAATFVRERLEAKANERIAPAVRDIAKLDPQRDAARFVRAQKNSRRTGTEGALVALLHADVFDGMHAASVQAAQRLPELLLAELGRVPAEFTRLAASYARSMWQVISHSDSRNAVEYMVEELERDDAQSCERSRTAQRRNVQMTGSRVFINRRALLVHAYARETERDVAVTARRVLHPVRERQPRTAAARRTEKALLDVLSEKLHERDAGAMIEEYGQKVIAYNGRVLDGFAQRLDPRIFFTDDVIKAFYVNLVYVSKALRLLNQHGLTAKDGCRDWLARAECETREQLHDQLADLLRDTSLRARALQHFRLELADGTSTVRFTAIAMLGRLGTLDDIGLLLDLASLLPRGAASRAEGNALLNSARRIAGVA